MAQLVCDMVRCSRSLIAMATDEVGVEIGVDTVARCKESLHAAELQVHT